mmetsp:Transcript_35582/g.100183  ORF Transcript_35582/g.100183 Transcript_35582/m.100183 type:complete len:234 (-) Transcript_35582:260-961(-)
MSPSPRLRRPLRGTRSARAGGSPPRRAPVRELPMRKGWTTRTRTTTADAPHEGDLPPLPPRRPPHAGGVRGEPEQKAASIAGQTVRCGTSPPHFSRRRTLSPQGRPCVAPYSLDLELPLRHPPNVRSRFPAWPPRTEAHPPATFRYPFLGHLWGLVSQMDISDGTSPIGYASHADTRLPVNPPGARNAGTVPAAPPALSQRPCSRAWPSYSTMIHPPRRSGPPGAPFFLPEMR